MKFLITCCNKTENRNLKNPNIFVYLVDNDNATVTAIDLGLDNADHGVTGACRYNNGWAFLVQNNIKRSMSGKPVRLIIISNELKVTDTINLSNVFDPHSMVQFEDGLVIVSTGHDQLIKFDARGVESVYRSFSQSNDGSLHVNSVSLLSQGLSVSTFGLSGGLLKNTARNGYIQCLSNNETIRGGLYHPHSLQSAGKDIWVCESGKGQVLCNGEVVIKVDKGYVRGLSVYGDRYLVVGVSRQRKKSKSLRREVYTPTPEKIGSCELRYYKRVSAQWELQSKIMLDDVTDEIYDVVAVSRQ
jgi:hypothetical protein